jgi:hypothetical protein
LWSYFEDALASNALAMNTVVNLGKVERERLIAWEIGLKTAQVDTGELLKKMMLKM